MQLPTRVISRDLQFESQIGTEARQTAEVGFCSVTVHTAAASDGKKEGLLTSNT
jgi:hypothetical protein